MVERTGIWLVGALGGLATTVVVGARAIGRGLEGGIGLTTHGDAFEGLKLAAVGDLVFGGHDVRSESPLDAARAISSENGSIRPGLVEALAEDLEEYGARIRPGLALNGGEAIDELVEAEACLPTAPLEDQVGRVRADLAAFKADYALDRLIVFNLASTEPPNGNRPEHADLAEFEAGIADNRRDAFRASQLYAYAAIAEGAALVNFTPSAALVPAIEEFAARQGLPFMGSDGKTGETLVKSALAPMFRDRALKVMSWQGYNILGDRDGQVLASKDNLASKVTSKDRALSGILGYPLHTHVGIDYVPSLGDMKTAWDFIHFQGFLGFPMSLQFTWQGCDAILAAPLVIDMARLADLAMRRGESGPMPQLACFFKSPHGSDEHDFHRQWASLLEYAARGA